MMRLRVAGLIPVILFMNQAGQNILAIVGRPNVGKSALFNRIAGRRIAIVHEQSGVTRDRVSAAANWQNKFFEVVDTGGIAFMDNEKSGDALATASRQQAEVAIEMASVIILVTDVTAGVTPLDQEIARKLRRCGKRVLLAVNKVDNNGRKPGVAEFSELGLEEIFPIAAVHGLGTTELLEAATQDFPDGNASSEVQRTRIAFVGRPNAGKSSLMNYILKSERTIVNETPGTTRDSVDVPFDLDGKPYTLVDTAGLRHKGKINSSVDQFGLMRAERSITECDLAVLVLDAEGRVSKQDKKIGGLILDANRACVILVNKWDLIEEDERRVNAKPKKEKGAGTYREEYLASLQRELFFLSWAPVLFASAKTGANVNRLFELVRRVEKGLEKRVETPELNRVLTRALASYPPPTVRAKRFKIFYAFQSETRPPTFTLFVNDGGLLTPHYQRFLVERIRDVWSFEGSPILFKMRQRERREFHKKLDKTESERTKSRS